MHHLLRLTPWRGPALVESAIQATSPCNSRFHSTAPVLDAAIARVRLSDSEDAARRVEAAEEPFVLLGTVYHC